MCTSLHVAAHPTVLFCFFFGEVLAQFYEVEHAVVDNWRANADYCAPEHETGERKRYPPLTHDARRVMATHLVDLVGLNVTC